jgi:regulator of protease activity HflC (stomatin/prohibitin superfamily)
MNALKLVGVVVLCIVGMLLANLAFRLAASPSDWNVAAGVVIIIILAVAIVTFGEHLVKSLRQYLGIALLFVVGALTLACGTTIQPGHAGIIVDAYGKDRGVQSYTATTGRVWYNPITTTVFEYPTFVQSVVFTASPNEGKAVNEEITFTNADQMSIAADVSLSYSLDVSKLPNFYVKFRSDDLNQFTYGYLRSLMRDKFNESAGRYTIAQIMGDNGPFLAEVKQKLQTDLEPIGVHLESQFGFIGAPRPPAQVIQSINMKVQATQLAIQKQNELVQVEADAKKAVAKATGDANALNVWAEAQAAANRKIAESLTANLVQYKALEKWNGSLPQVSGAGVPFINLQPK